MNPQPPQHNYLVVLARLAAEGRFEPGEVYANEIRHDDWCGFLATGGRCNCNPEVTIRKVTEAMFG